MKRLFRIAALALGSIALCGPSAALAHASAASGTSTLSHVLETSPTQIVLKDLETSVLSIQLFDQSQAQSPIVLSAVASPPVVGRSLGISRFASYLGAALLLGGLFLVLVCSPDVQHAWATRRLLWFGWTMLAVGAVANFALLGVRANADSLRDILDISAWGDSAGTRSGKLLLARICVAAVFVPMVLAINRRRARWWRFGVALLGVLAVFTFSGAGRPSVTSPAALWIVVDAVHLGFVALWVGGLGTLACGGRAWLHSSEHASAVHSFAKMSTLAVPLIVATGAAQTLRLTGSIDTLTDTSWGRVLLVKVVIATLVVTLGGASRWLLHHEGPSSLGRTIATETVLALGVLGLTAGLVSLTPQVAVQAQFFSASLTQDGTTADISMSPGAVGSNEMHIIVTPPGGNLQPIAGLTARMTLDTAGSANLAVEVVAVGPNHYTGTITLPVAGQWRLELVIATTASETVLLQATVPIP